MPDTMPGRGAREGSQPTRLRVPSHGCVSALAFVGVPPVADVCVRSRMPVRYR